MNDTDTDSPLRPLAGRIVILTQPTKGTLTNPLNGVTASGGFTYTATRATPQYTGEDSFTYKVIGRCVGSGVPFSPDSGLGGQSRSLSGESEVHRERHVAI